MRKEGRRAGEPRTITHRKEDATARGPPLFLGTRNLNSPSPRPSGLRRLPPLPDLSARATRPWSGLRDVRRGPPPPGRPCSFHGGSWSKQGCAQRGLGSAGKRRPRKQLWASELGGARGGGGGAPHQSPSRPLPHRFLPGGAASPRGDAWQGTALLCVAGPVGFALRWPPSGQWGWPF